MIDKKQPIVVKKVSQNAHGHHGGAWKVAFADFVTAMMAFFLLMWLVASTTKEQRAGISEYFNNPSLVAGASSVPSPSSVQGPGGASTSLIKLGGAMSIPTHEKREVLKEESDKAKEKRLKDEQKEKERLDELMDKLKKAIEESQALKPFKDQLLLDITPEGLRIQIVDKENRPMFDSGKADLKFYTVQILFELSRFINQVPNHISISGHTDASPFRGREDYSNWELSADRANAARRALLAGGMEANKIGRVVGLASSTLFDKEDPYNPINRRIAIIVMNKKTEEAIEKGEGVTEEYLRQRRDVHNGGVIDLPMEVLEPGKSDIDLDN